MTTTYFNANGKRILTLYKEVGSFELEIELRNLIRDVVGRRRYYLHAISKRMQLQLLSYHEPHKCPHCLRRFTIEHDGVILHTSGFGGMTSICQEDECNDYLYYYGEEGRVFRTPRIAEFWEPCDHCANTEWIVYWVSEDGEVMKKNIFWFEKTEMDQFSKACKVRVSRQCSCCCSPQPKWKDISASVTKIL